MSTNSTTPVSDGTAIGAVTISGIQDVSGFLPLLGTEQCEEHVSNTLARGWLYGAATSMSMFGSLGILQAGLYTIFISVDWHLWHGPRLLKNAGFSAKGVLHNLEYEKDTDDSVSVAEGKIRSILGDYRHIGKVTTVYNLFSLSGFQYHLSTSLSQSATLYLSSLGLTPFIYVIIIDLPGRPFSQTWLYPMLRVYGCAAATIAIQGIIQLRTLAIVYDRLQFNVFNNWFEQDLKQKPPHFWKTELRAAESLSLLKKQFDQGMYSPTRFDDILLKAGVHRLKIVLYVTGSLVIHRVCLFLAIMAAGIGYVGCFGLIQASNSVNSTGPILWLVLEVVLCLLRLCIWAANPDDDDPPPLLSIQDNGQRRQVTYQWNLDEEATHGVHAVIFGSNATSADNAESGAKSMCDCLLKRFGIPKDQIKLRQGATSNDIKTTLQEMAADDKIKYGDSSIIYISCHAGTRQEQDESTPLCFMTADYTCEDPGTGLSYQTLLRIIENISHSKGNDVTLFLDICYDDPIGQAEKSDIWKHIESKYNNYVSSHVLIAAWSKHPCHGQEGHVEESKGPSNPDCPRRPFTQALQTVIENMADNHDRGLFLFRPSKFRFNNFLHSIRTQLSGKNQNLVFAGRHLSHTFKINNLFGRTFPVARQSAVLVIIDGTSEASQEPYQTV